VTTAKRIYDIKAVAVALAKPGPMVHATTAPRARRQPGARRGPWERAVTHHL
jgi:hypothetical protein